jgi:hypothetical protein
MNEPRRIWWPLPGRLCVLERPGGGGRSHRPERREAEIAYLSEHKVRAIVSTMKTRHNLEHYEAAGFDWEHIPVPDVAKDGKEALPRVVSTLERLMAEPGAVALHGNRLTDFVAAAAVAYLKKHHGGRPKALLVEASNAGLRITPEAAKLVGVRDWKPDQPASQPRSAIAVSTSSGRSVTT